MGNIIELIAEDTGQKFVLDSRRGRTHWTLGRKNFANGGEASILEFGKTPLSRTEDAVIYKTSEGYYLENEHSDDLYIIYKGPERREKIPRKGYPVLLDNYLRNNAQMVLSIENRGFIFRYLEETNDNNVVYADFEENRTARRIADFYGLKEI